MAERGWSGPHSLLTREEAARLASVLAAWAPAFTQPEEMRAARFAPESFAKRPWFKSLHAYVPEVFELVSSPTIIRHVLPLVGQDVVAWGTTRTVRVPGQTHRWHVDVEHMRWRGVSVFVGLANTEHAGLRFVDGSHKIMETPQEAGVSTDAEVVARASRYLPSAQVSEPLLPIGSMLVFEGRTWHASTNRGPDVRVGLLLQYAGPHEDFAIPLNWDAPIRWHEESPPCVRAAGLGVHPAGHVISGVLRLDHARE